MRESFWNQRYGVREYAYGIKPNEYFKQFIDRHPAGRLLLPGEGEGRNAVYAAGAGWKVDAIDQSSEGRKKAGLLAKQHNVDINYRVQDLLLADFSENYYDLAALIFVHFPSTDRLSFHQKLVTSLKPGGHILIEAFSKSQLGKPSGGPGNPDLLNNMDELKNDFESLEIVDLHEEDIILDEGAFHQGAASVVRMLARKR